MGQVLIRNLDDAVVSRLKNKAEEAEKSLEQYLRELLTRESQAMPKEDFLALAKHLRAQTKTGGPDPTDLIREDRDNNFGRNLP